MLESNHKLVEHIQVSHLTFNAVFHTLVNNSVYKVSDIILVFGHQRFLTRKIEHIDGISNVLCEPFFIDRLEESPIIDKLLPHFIDNQVISVYNLSVAFKKGYIVS